MVASSLVVSIALSLGSAACYGVATALQHHAAVRQPEELSMRPGLLIKLFREPRWQIGNVLDASGFALQFLALRMGAVALVEALLVTGLLVALWVGAFLDHRRITFHELAMAGLVGLGVALFLTFARPTLHGELPSASSSIALAAAVIVTVVATVIAARASTRPQAAVLLAIGAAIAFAYTAALTALTGHLLVRGVVHVVASWPPYALVATGIAAIMLTQSAFNAGPLRLSLPTLTVVQPVIATAMGWLFLGQRVYVNGLAPIWEACGLAGMAIGVFFLVMRSPDLVSPAEGAGESAG